MLDMGFQEDIKVVDAIPQGEERGCKPFSSVQRCPHGSNRRQETWLTPKRRPVQDDNRKASTSVQHLCIKCPWQKKPAAAGDCIRVYGGVTGRAILFCETKKECNDLAQDQNLNVVRGGCGVLHGDIPQKQRERKMLAFRDCKIRILIATDVAARGLDVDGVDLVIQTQPPAKNFSGRADTETYVHRSGRTGRAGRKGTCITFFTHAQEPLITSIERVIGNEIKRIGTPQLEDLAKASGMVEAQKCKAVDKRLLEYFRPAVEDMLKSFDSPELALCAALAQSAGYIAYNPRSLLSAEEGFKTVMFQSELGQPMGTASYVWSHIRREFSASLADQIRGMTVTHDGTGAVFDVRGKDVAEIEKYIKRHGKKSKFTFPQELPKLKPREKSYVTLWRAWKSGRGVRVVAGPTAGGAVEEVEVGAEQALGHLVLLFEHHHM